MSKVSFTIENNELLSDLRAASPNPTPPLPAPPPPSKVASPVLNGVVTEVRDAFGQEVSAPVQAGKIAQSLGNDIIRNPGILDTAYIAPPAVRAGDSVAIRNFEAAKATASRNTGEELANLVTQPASAGLSAATKAKNYELAQALADLNDGTPSANATPSIPSTFTDAITKQFMELYRGAGYVLTRPADGEGQSTLYLADDVTPEQSAEIMKEVATTIAQANAADEGLEVDEGALDQIFDDQIAAFMSTQVAYTSMSMRQEDEADEDRQADRTTSQRST